MSDEQLQACTEESREQLFASGPGARVERYRKFGRSQAPAFLLR